MFAGNKGKARRDGIADSNKQSAIQLKPWE